MKTAAIACCLLFSTGAPILHGQAADSKVVECDFGKVRIKHQPKWPPYPEDWPPLKSRAIVTLSVLVGEDGTPVSVTALEGPDDSSKYAQLHLSNWRFFPVEIDGKPQKFRFKISVPVPVPPKKS